MIDKYYKSLGVSPEDSNEVIKEKYLELKKKYEEERFSEDSDVGNNAAKRLTEIEVAYNAIVNYRFEHAQSGTTAEAFNSVEAAIRSGNLSSAQQLLDDFDERTAEWHYYQSVVFYKKNWINESKKQLEIAIAMSPDEPKYKSALDKINARVNEGAKINNDWNRSGNGGYQNAGAYQQGAPDQQLGGDSCLQWCCDMIICNMLLNCCCNCR
jgi:curved DNA-binding protein CbpA